MGEAIGQSLPTAVGIALSPVPIIAVVLMLVTPRGRVNGPCFILGWTIGLATVGAIALAVAGGANASSDGAPADWVNVLKLVLGALLLLMAFRVWRARPAPGAESPSPKWMGAVEGFTAVKAVATGSALAALNPKNLLLAVAGAAAIAGTGISTGQQIVSYAVFVLVATLGVGAPVVIYFVLGERSAAVLDRLKGWMAQHNAAIMAVVLLIIGAKLVGDAISGFFA